MQGAGLEKRVTPSWGFGAATGDDENWGDERPHSRGHTVQLRDRILALSLPHCATVTGSVTLCFSLACNSGASTLWPK